MFDFIKELLWQMEGKEVTCAGGGTCSLLPMRRILSITQACLYVVPRHFKNHGQASTFIIILPQGQCPPCLAPELANQFVLPLSRALKALLLKTHTLVSSPLFHLYQLSFTCTTTVHVDKSLKIVYTASGSKS